MGAAACIIDKAGYKALPIGSEDFAEVVSTAVYVDKSLLIRDLIESNFKVTLFCRPRRFGKSLAVRMLQRFFELPVEGWVLDASSLFEGLAVQEAGERTLSHQAKHPVIFLSLGALDDSSWERALLGIAQQVASEYNRHGYLLANASLMTSAESDAFARLCAGEASRAELETSLSLLSNLLERHHRSGTVILIDEYDRPVTGGYLKGYREEAVAFMRAWLTGALKATTSLYRACLTGVQRVSRESIFSGLNNMVVDTALDSRFTEGFGFTDSEVSSLLAYIGVPEKLDELRSWYDGYNFGGVATYNPWSALNYIASGCAAQPYWGNTSDNAVVHQLFERASNGEAEELRSLASGGTVVEPLDLTAVLAGLDNDPRAIWSQLYLSGYLTTDDVVFPNDDETPRELRVPNREVRWLYRKEFSERSSHLAGSTRSLLGLHKGLIAGDVDGVRSALREILLNSPSAFDLVRENSYHMLVLGLLYSVAGYRFPLSNREAGEGRPDIVLEPEPEKRQVLPAVVVEIKHGEEGDAFDLAQRALAQIEDKAYAHGLAGNGALLWGIAFAGRHVSCAVKRQP